MKSAYTSILAGIILSLVANVSAQNGNIEKQLSLQPLYPFSANELFNGKPEANFGIYTIVFDDETAYAALARGAPHENNKPGVVLIKIDDNINLERLTEPSSLSEEGMNNMYYSNGKLFLPGVDPTESWENGNYYIYDITSTNIKKFRNIPRAIHIDANTVNGSTIYIGTHSLINYQPNPPNLPNLHRGELFRGEFNSTNNTITWQSISPVSGSWGKIMHYYDLKFFDNRLYTLARMGPATGTSWQNYKTKLAYSEDNGVNWNVIANSEQEYHAKLYEWDGKLVYIKNKEKLVSITSNNILVEHSQPDFTFVRDYNSLTVVPETQKIFTIAEDNKIYTSLNGDSWSEFYTSPEPLASIHFWPNKNALLLSTRGPEASLIYIPLDTSEENEDCVRKTEGDADCDDDIDNNDYEIWRAEFKRERSTKTADFNDDSVVSSIDYEIWRTSRFD